jgi:hypothetical protein
VQAVHTLALAERAKGEDSIAPLAKLDDACAHAGLDKIRERLK